MSTTAVCMDGPLKGLVCRFHHVQAVMDPEGAVAFYQIFPPDTPPTTPQGTYAMLVYGQLVWAGPGHLR